VDFALPSDRSSLLAIVERHERPHWRSIFEAWWELARSAFRIGRESTGRVLGFALVAPAHELPPALAEADPLLAAWRADLEASPGRDRGALFMRRALSEPGGEAATDVRAAIWLDIKRSYVERPSQWALYVGTRQADTLLPFLRRLGFTRTSLTNDDESTLRLEFGAAGIWSWLRGLMNADESAQEARPESPAWQLDRDLRGLVIDGRAVPLSSLEYRVLRHLLERAGQVVTRDELLDAVWEQRHTGSNVVDAVVRLLRKKLGPYAAEIQTVRGHGFRVVRVPTL
jgi:hypothetical protein